MESAVKTELGSQIRSLVRAGEFAGQTSGRAPDYLQGNVVILPERYASDFLQFCLNNPKPCPLIGLSKPGEPTIPALGNDIDIRRDVPSYWVYRDGVLSDRSTDIRDLWTSEMVAFVLGCSFTFEAALIRNGYHVRHVELGCNVPMFKTNIETIPGGIFSGPMVVTMRSFPGHQIPEIFDLSFRYPHAHGTPIHWGDPEEIGISDVRSPDYGDAVEVPDDEVLVFWACGVTPQASIERAKPDICITHAPGCMLVTDVLSVDVLSATPPVIDVSLTLLLTQSTSNVEAKGENQ